MNIAQQKSQHQSAETQRTRPKLNQININKIYLVKC
jgi:hypothetical protein